MEIQAGFGVRSPELHLTRISVAPSGLPITHIHSPGLADLPGAILCRASGAPTYSSSHKPRLSRQVEPRRGGQRVAGGECTETVSKPAMGTFNEHVRTGLQTRPHNP
jgi:hypothetical protein